jgi:hypothetical protein
MLMCKAHVLGLLAKACSSRKIREQPRRLNSEHFLARLVPRARVPEAFAGFARPAHDLKV